MLRLETKQTGVTTIKNIGSGLVNHATYSNKIREVLSHYPTGHYMSLISAYSPISIFDNVGSFSIIKATGDKLLHYDGSIPFKNLGDLQIRCSNKYVFTQITPQGQIEFKLLLPERQATYILSLSPTAAWCFGFEKTQYTFGKPAAANHLQPCIRSDHKHIPITLQYLQIICRNVCGTSDSNMTMPTCIGIMHITNNFSLVNPHIAVNHRINEGRVIDIEILDQNNRPFTLAPVYLELFITESAEHEKKQGFFRFEKPHAILLHSPVTKLSVPDFFFLEPTFTFEYGKDAYIEVTSKKVRRFYPHKDPYFLSLRGTVITKTAMVNIFKYINNYFLKEIGPNPSGPYITAWLDGDDLVLMTTVTMLTITPDFITAWHIRKTDLIKLYEVISPTTRIKIPPYVWYNKDSRINLYCKEYHERYPIVSARRIHDRYQVINPLFWAWHELEKPTNKLHFRADHIVTYPDGSVDARPFSAKIEGDWAPIFQLFYK